MRKKIVLAAGGSGGHVIPAQAIALELIKKGHDIAFAGFDLSKNPYIDHELFACHNVSSAPLTYNIPRFVYYQTKGFFQAKRLFDDYQPDVIIGFGSFHTVPILAAATILRRPFVLFAADTHPGRVIRLFSPCAQWTACYFHEAKALLKGRSFAVQFPLRPQFSDLPSREESIRRYGFTHDTPILLVVGGSLGASILNTIVPQAVALMNTRVAVLHICGKNANVNAVQTLYQAHGISAKVLPYEEHMEFAYQAADCVIARSGASSIAEIRHCGKKAVYIPYPYAVDGHQMKNALSAAATDHAVALEQALATPEVIAERIQRLLSEPMRACARQGSSESFIQLLDSIGCI
jgi:UDP-N-acetylglucosamine--N-acetylmuramyl-(pentapeptide) pyrophosphoryl-undecaprenol N-acetylglucosamine transferase